LPRTDRNYYMKAFFDLRDWPDCKINSDCSKDIKRNLRTSSATNTIVLIKDIEIGISNLKKLRR